MDNNWEYGEQYIVQERAVLKEWHYLECSLLNFTLTTSHSTMPSWRNTFGKHIIQITEGRARIWWKAYTAADTMDKSLFFEICHQQIYYGMLELVAGYLISNFLPDIPRHFTDLCAFLIYKAEHERFVRHQLAQLPPIISNGARKPLTAREKDVLLGLIRGENESEMASRLGITLSTVHTHLQRLYSRLDVHSAQQVILRAFEIRLIDWLDVPE